MTVNRDDADSTGRVDGEISVTADVSTTTRRTVLRAGGLAVAGALAGCSAATGIMGERDAERPIQAHRCFAEDHPENTRLAAERAVDVADQLEIDVRRCGSGELVVFHDETVDAKTDGNGEVSELSWDELRDLHVADSEERIPLLSEMLDVVPTDVAVNVELKEHDLATDVLRTASAYDHDVILSSIRPTILQQADEAREPGEVETALVGVSSPARALETATAMNCDRIHLSYDLLVETNALEVAKDAGLWVHTGTLRSANEYALAREMDVDGFSGDTAAIFED